MLAAFARTPLHRPFRRWKTVPTNGPQHCRGTGLKRRYQIADVFTDTVYEGNPVAVVLVAEGLSAAEMQRIAVEFDYSETTFVTSPRDPANSARVRILTPGREVPFAGHPDIGTASSWHGCAPPVATGPRETSRLRRRPCLSG